MFWFFLRSAQACLEWPYYSKNLNKNQTIIRDVKTKNPAGFEPWTLGFASERATAGPTSQGFGRNFKTCISLSWLFVNWNLQYLDRGFESRQGLCFLGVKIPPYDLIFIMIFTFIWSFSHSKHFCAHTKRFFWLSVPTCCVI